MKTLLSLATFISGCFLAYGIGSLIYRIRRGPSLMVGSTPIILALVVMVVTQSGGNINDMTLLQVAAAGLSLGMVSCGAYLFWSQRSWGNDF